jgi:hypothetical protein
VLIDCLGNKVIPTDVRAAFVFLVLFLVLVLVRRVLVVQRWR